MCLKGYHKLAVIKKHLPRHVLSITVEQLLRGDQLGLAVTVPVLLARLAASDDFT